MSINSLEGGAARRGVVWKAAKDFYFGNYVRTNTNIKNVICSFAATGTFAMNSVLIFNCCNKL